jgi:hypothetical protein
MGSVVHSTDKNWRVVMGNVMQRKDPVRTRESKGSCSTQ